MVPDIKQNLITSCLSNVTFNAISESLRWSRACLHAPVFNHKWYYLLPFLKVLCEQGHARFLPSNRWETSKCLYHLTTIPEKKLNPVDMSRCTFTCWYSLGVYGDAPNTGKGCLGKEVSKGWPWTLSQIFYMISRKEGSYGRIVADSTLDYLWTASPQLIMYFLLIVKA